MAVEDFPTQSTEQSTQSTQSGSQDRPITDTEIWGSLIPFNHHNPHVSRIDFERGNKIYKIGRSRRAGVNDLPFPYAGKMSQRHCIIEWDGEETSTSAVIVKDLDSSNGTYVNGKRLGKGECGVLKDWNVVSFGTSCDKSAERPRDDYRFFFRHMASNQRPRDGLYKFYDVHHVLGKGGYATVVKALHKAEAKWYAVKMFSGDRLRELLSSASIHGTDERMSRTADHLKREVYVLQRMKHDYICQLKEAFFEEYSVSIVLELVPGGDLMSYMLKKGVLLEPEAQYFTYQICDALAYVHKKGIVHRDLKPENVLLTDDHPPIVKVADFGFAKVIDSLSMMQTRCGTPAFVAPEVMDPTEQGYDKVVDSWSLGVMVFMLLSRQTPFSDETRGEPNWNLLRDYNISDTGIDFIGRLLEYKPDARMTPAQALKHEWLAGQASKQRTRKIERELSLARRVMESHPTPASAHTSHTSATPTATSTSATPTMTARTPIPSAVNGRKRKAGNMLSLGRSLSSMSVEDKNGDDGAEQRGVKRVRIATSAAQVVDKAHYSYNAWTPISLDADEIPGLGTWQIIS
ncbi:kinase-like domain-containing protein [Fomes fomentarius]|nr:kinase-like domain-containing protein [Fomes fomentarius]